MRKRLSIKYILLILITVTAGGSDIFGQCENATSDRDLFDSVDIQYRENLIRRYETFLRRKCHEDIAGVYEMMLSSFREVNSKDQFMETMKKYYFGNDRFLSFEPTKVSEFRLSDSSKVSFWFIDGCITEVIKGKKRSRVASLEANIEGTEIFFTDITTRPNPLADGETCRCRKTPKPR